MRFLFSIWIVVVVCVTLSLARTSDCPDYPAPGIELQDPYAIYSQNGVLQATFTLAHSVDVSGFTHYCYKYQSPSGIVEAPTLRLNRGDQLQLTLIDRIRQDEDAKDAHDSFEMEMPNSPTKKCGDGGAMTVRSTNMHFHGMNVPPTCHQDDVIDTLIQPGRPGFDYNIQVPADEPPGLYWYHPHVHGFTEFQVNGGAAGALIVEGMDKVRPEVAGLTERVFVIRQQYLVPWIPGPYKLTINDESADFPREPLATVPMNPGEKQFWRVANATLQDFMPLQVLINGKAEKLEIIALDGYPLKQTKKVDTILVPPAGRAEFIVEAPPAGQFGQFITQAYDTGPTGNADVQQILAEIQLSPSGGRTKPAPAQTVQAKSSESTATSAPGHMKFDDLEAQKPSVERKLYFSEEFGGTNGPIQFYITVDGQKQKVFAADEKPVITTKVGAVEDWTIENRALETHAFHMHQIHFKLLEVDGKHVDPVMLDTVAIPFWDGKSAYHRVKVRMDFRDPTTAGTFVFHCHILLHEDLGMMHKILVEP